MTLNNVNLQIENNELSFIQENIGVKLLQELPSDLSQISYTFEEESEKEIITFEEFMKKFSFIKKEDFDNLKIENVGENSLLEIYKTYIFLNTRFSKAKEKLNKNGFELDDLLKSLIKRLLEQVIEAGKGQRKLKNGIVVGLSKFSKDKYEFMKVPYYAFACANVSLDIVNVKDKYGKQHSLREVDDMMSSRNDEGGLFLPNSMGVSANLMTTDENGDIVFIAQERNNATTLTQRAKLVSSASGAVDYKIFGDGINLGLLHNAIGEEVKEELGVNPTHSKLSEEEIKSKISLNVGGILDSNQDYKKIEILGNILTREGLEILGRELGLDANLLPSALVMEDKRRNPEFIFLGKIGYTLDQVINAWENAESKEESLSIKGITYKEILEDLENRKNGGVPKIDNHFFMSYIGFLIKSIIGK